MHHSASHIARDIGRIAAVVTLAAVVLSCRGEAVSGRTPAAAVPAASGAAGLPRLVDVGAGKCIPCKAMAPILEEIRAEYAGRMEVQFIDAWKDPAAAEPYGVRIIPTQIFYGADGKELARHQGFMSKADILAQWRAVGVSLQGR